jgi:hypothetical protein
MSRLDDAARRVPADSSPADNEELETTDDLELDAGAAGDADDSEDEQGEKKERNVENVRGELLRKMKKEFDELKAQISTLGAENKTLREQLASPSQAPKGAQSPKTFDDMSVAELMQVKDQIPEKDKEAFNEYLIQRRIDEQVDRKLGKFESQNTFKEQEDRYTKQAFDRWPELRNKSSEFYGITDRILSEMGPAADKNPRAVLDAANEAGLDLGLAPSTGYSRSPRNPGKVAPGRTTKGVAAREPEPTEQDAAIAKRLANAMPGKKFSEKQLKRIAKRSKQYKDQINTHVRG